MDRVDGRLKVTGGARYSSDIPIPDLVHAVIVQSTIARGRIRSIDTREAVSAPGVIHVMTHHNALRLNRTTFTQPLEPPGSEGRGLLPLQDDKIFYNGQHIAVVVADTLERATHAAALVRVSYDEEQPIMDFERGIRQRAFKPTTVSPTLPPDVSRGDAANAFQAADVRVDQTYRTPDNHHNPMGPFATTAVWSGRQLTVYDATQWVYNARRTLSEQFGMPPTDVRVISHFMGGGFGAALRTWGHVTLAAMAARAVERPVKLVLTREQMFTSVGYRPRTVQRLRLGATRDGKLTAILHEGYEPNALEDEFVEGLMRSTPVLYACPNMSATYRLVRLSVGCPSSMRAPGEATAMFALDSAMDELAYALKLDPLELRLRNYADANPHNGKPWSIKALRDCYRWGAERIGWQERNPGVRSMRDGRYLIGYGMASGIRDVLRDSAIAVVKISADGSVLVQSATSDIGPGTYTVMTQIAAEALGIPMERVRFEFGDTNLPEAPNQGGSVTVASVGSVVQEAAIAARAKLLALVQGDSRSPLRGEARGTSWGGERAHIQRRAIQHAAKPTGQSSKDTD